MTRNQSILVAVIWIASQTWPRYVAAAGVAEIESAYREKVSRHHAESQAGLNKLHEDYIAALEATMQALTKEGDLDNAVAVRDKLKVAQRYKTSTDRSIISELGNTVWKDARGHSYSFFADGTCLGDGPGKYNAPCCAVGKDAVVVCWYQGQVVGAYDLFIWDEPRSTYKRHHFQIEKDTQPVSTGEKAAIK
jgi:hypothetical protein